MNSKKVALEILLRYINEAKEIKTPDNLILAGVVGRIEGMLDNIKAEEEIKNGL